MAVAAFAFFGGYERLREGARKPYLIHSHLFSNGLRIEEIEAVNRSGMAARSGWVASRSGEGPVATGREIFKVQCSSCHTLDGYQAIRTLLPRAADFVALAANEPPGSGEGVFQTACASCHRDATWEEMRETIPAAETLRQDPAMAGELAGLMVSATLVKLRDMGDFYASAGGARMIDARELRYPQMPPLVGTLEEVEALAAYLGTLQENGPAPVKAAGTGGER